MKRERPVSNFWNDINVKVAANDDTLSYIVIRNASEYEPIPSIPEKYAERMLTVDEAKPLLDYTYEPG